MRGVRGFSLCAVPILGVLLLAASTPAPRDHAHAGTAASPPAHLIGRDIATYALIQSIAGPGLGGAMRPDRTMPAAPAIDPSCPADAGDGGGVQLARCSLLPLPGEEPKEPEKPSEPPPPATGGKTPEEAGFAYYPPGKMHANDLRQGRVGDRYVYLPNIVFPLKLGQGLFPHMNSQIFGYGGGGWGGGGGGGGFSSGGGGDFGGGGASGDW